MGLQAQGLVPWGPLHWGPQPPLPRPLQPRRERVTFPWVFPASHSWAQCPKQRKHGERQGALPWLTPLCCWQHPCPWHSEATFPMHHMIYLCLSPAVVPWLHPGGAHSKGYSKFSSNNSLASKCNPQSKRWGAGTVLLCHCTPCPCPQPMA